METIFAILAIVCFCILCTSIMSLGYTILGGTNELHAHPLSDAQKDIIRQYGIIHITTNESAASIISQEIVYASKGILHNYSHASTRNCFFFMNRNLADLDLGFNMATDRNIGVTIQNLTEDQIDKLLIRDYDNALLYTGDFSTEGCNMWSSAQLTGTYTRHTPVSYILCLLASVAISFAIHAMIIITATILIFALR